MGQIGTAEPVREAEVVLDPRALTGLPSGRVAFDHDRSEPFRRCVHGCCKTSGTSTHDHDVVQRGFRGGVEPQCTGEIQRGRAVQHGALGQQH